MERIDVDVEEGQKSRHAVDEEVEILEEAKDRQVATYAEQQISFSLSGAALALDF